MNRYQPSSPRITLGIAAAAMAAITIGVSVVMPAAMHTDSAEPRMLEALKVNAPASTRAVTGSESIDVIAVHEGGLSTVPCTSSKPSPAPEG